jgi:hypothetical protein
MMSGQNPETGDDVRPVSERLVVRRHWEPAYAVPIVSGPGGHGGGDARLLNAVFRRDEAPDPLGRSGWLHRRAPQRGDRAGREQVDRDRPRRERP